MSHLTSRQQEILALIQEHLERFGMPPTRAEIARHFGFSSPNAADSHLRALARKGVIELVPGSSRGVRLTTLPFGSATFRKEKETPQLPVIGRVAAGRPILAVEQFESHCAIAPDLFQPRADYLLRVSGMSMRDVGILDGDLLAVHQTEEARNGQIVVARLNDEVTVKRFRRQGGVVLLLPENPEFPHIEVKPSDTLAIEGWVVGVLRIGTQP